jgi:hypothetical protein
MAIRVLPVTGNDAAKPSDLDASAIAVIAYTLRNSDRSISPSIVNPHAGSWKLACFVVGADTLREARKAAEDWIGSKRVALLSTKVGGQAAKLEVVEETPPPPPERTVRDWDPTTDEVGDDGIPTGEPL